ncbi:MAG: DUF3999 family protein [Steroidobacteraceae bacterium]
MRLGAGVLLLALFFALPEIRYFRYERPIQTAPQQTGQTCLVVDPAIFAHAAPQLADLRLYHDDAETPYVIRVATAAAGAEKSIQTLNLGVRGGETVFDAELPDMHYSDLSLAVTAQNFIATVSVSGSRNKAASTATKLGTYTIFDLTKQRLGRSTVLHLPESDFPYLHFRIEGSLHPDHITGLSVERLPATQPTFVSVAESSQFTQKDRTTVFEFTVPAHVPVDRVVFTPGPTPPQFSREVNISVVPIAPPPATDREEPPQAVTSPGSLLRIHSVQDGKRLDEERLTIEAPRAYLWSGFDTVSKWTVTVDNGDDLPISVKSLQLQMLQRTLCFDAVAHASYALYYGDSELSAPRYDYAMLFAPQANPAHVAAGAEQPNPALQSRPDERPFSEKHPALLWIALIAVIALLGAIALKSRKRATPTP